MEALEDIQVDDMPYRASINPEAYERCGQAYLRYFEELDRLGPLEESEVVTSARKESGKKSRVGAKPLSGVRGIYYTRGTWRVQYRGVDREVVTCVFTYDSKDVLIATFDLAFKLLRKVIDLGRQMKSEDGMIITSITEERLLDLDRRSKLRPAKQDSASSKELTTASGKRISRQRQDKYLDDCEDDDEDSDSDNVYSPVRKKTRLSTEDASKKSKMLPYHAPMPYMGGTSTGLLPAMPCYAGKMNSFERMFQSYGSFTTHQLINYLIEKNCMRSNERALAERQKRYHTGNTAHTASVGEFEGKSCPDCVEELRDDERGYTKDVDPVNNVNRSYLREPNGWYCSVFFVIQLQKCAIWWIRCSTRHFNQTFARLRQVINITILHD
ncbi:uncharacterized protein BXIN_1207 [Babesia sp. Xinjiang]|uniref:uncharacterized protein n=1 Tax=Babesia sp. Xinjiang TaxID=462227 RepID=UPI000A238CEC|nr:uncharacterized protein BXIN_1207 [Babesia sp. Xinjiang]ORM40118.1 hypothetical protein BXIN_1207 [Babesia sp. Xinjiang]